MLAIWKPSMLTASDRTPGWSWSRLLILQTDSPSHDVVLDLFKQAKMFTYVVVDSIVLIYRTNLFRTSGTVTSSLYNGGDWRPVYQNVSTSIPSVVPPRDICIYMEGFDPMEFDLQIFIGGNCLIFSLAWLNNVGKCCWRISRVLLSWTKIVCSQWAFLQILLNDWKIFEERLIIFNPNSFCDSQMHMLIFIFLNTMQFNLLFILSKDNVIHSHYFIDL